MYKALGLSSALQPNPEYPQISMGKPSKIFSMTTVLFFSLTTALELEKEVAHTLPELFKSQARCPNQEASQWETVNLITVASLGFLGKEVREA